MKDRVLLVLPPYSDYTYPYHSIAYLISPLRTAGYEVDAIDLSIEWFRCCFTSARLRAWQAMLEQRLDELEHVPRWLCDEQRDAVRIVQALGICRQIDPEKALHVFRSPHDFYNYEAYLNARNQVRNFERLLNCLYPSYDFYNAFAVPPYTPNCTELVRKSLASAELIDEFASILSERFGNRKYLMCGVSMSFSAHLQLGLTSMAAARSVFPDATIVGGGTAITDIAKYALAYDTLRPLSAVCDYIVLGEGEVTFPALADRCCGSAASLPPAVMNLRHPEPLRTFQHRYVDIRREPVTPDYSWIDWDLYLSPERQVNYSPSRGCFWNKCTFCDYGLNEDSPTAPSRTMDVSTVMEHVRDITRQGIHHIYFAVDAIAPSFLREFSERACREQVCLFWSGEFFLTPQFTPAMVSRMAESGLVSASFGLESGSSRILEKMGKGANRVETVLTPVFDAFRATTVGLQPKFFFGFPGETEAERQMTVDLLNANRDIFSVVTNSNYFALTAGSEVAKKPEKFGIRRLWRRKGDDIGGALDYELEDGSPSAGPMSYSHFNEQLDYFHAYERPWVGGIDTFHTLLYLKRFGKAYLHELQRTFRKRDDVTRSWVQTTTSSRFDMTEVFDNVLIRSALGSECTLERAREMLGDGEMQVALQELDEPVLPAAEAATYELYFR